NTGSAGGGPEWLYPFDNKVFFVADDGTHGFEIWMSDGTDAGTKMVKEINPGTATPTYMVSQATLNNKVIFQTFTTANGKELWITDGTDAGTKMVKDINAGAADGNPLGMFTWNGKVYFFADDGTHGYELWQSDGTD